jgi:AMMECR1 domain-containing protein
LQILDVARPIELDEIYVHVNILDEPIDISKIETGRDSKMVKLDFTPMRDE